MRNSGEVELLIAIENEITKELVQIAVEHSPVIVICDSATVHGFTDEVPQRLPWKLFLTQYVRLCQVHRNKHSGDLEVRLVEVISDVPSDLSVLLSFLNCGVEE